MNKFLGKAAAIAILAGVAANLVGCMSYVKVYDGEDRLVGSCTSGSKLFGVIPFAWGNSGCVIKTIK